MKSAQKEDKHRRILEAAVRVFARKGFHHSRIAEVAREAGVASGTIYLYFKSKDEILISVFEESLEYIIESVLEAMKEVKDPRERLQVFIAHHLELLKEYRDLAEVLQVELRQSHKFMKEYEPRHWLRYINILAEILREGQQKGVFRNDLSLGVFKRAVFGALDEISLHWVMTGKGEAYLDRAARELSALLLEGLCRSGEAARVSSGSGKNRRPVKAVSRNIQP